MKIALLFFTMCFALITLQAQSDTISNKTQKIDLNARLTILENQNVIAGQNLQTFYQMHRSGTMFILGGVAISAVASIMLYAGEFSVPAFIIFGTALTFYTIGTIKIAKSYKFINNAGLELQINANSVKLKF